MANDSQSEMIATDFVFDAAMDGPILGAIYRF